MKPLQEFASNQQAGSGGRDPRKLGVVGDVLRKGNKTRKITEIRQGGAFDRIIVGIETVRTPRRFVVNTPEGWWRWAKDATVIHRSEEATP